MLCLVVFALSSVISYAASTSFTVRNTSLQTYALEGLKLYQQRDSRCNREKLLLCTIFVNILKIANKQNNHGEDLVRANMYTMRSFCDFAVLSYTCHPSGHIIIQDIAKSANATLRLYRCVKPVNGLNDHVSKVMMYDRLLPVVSQYERVWLLDEDLALQNFNFVSFFETLECAFWPRISPMVVQPVIAESNQDYSFANLATWAGTIVRACSTEFIEIQMPLFNATFFEWYVKYIVAPITLNEPQALLCAGFDSMFCKSADVFARAVLGSSMPSNYRHCAVITTHGTAVSHQNMRTINKEGSFKESSIRQAHGLQQLFPKFMHWNFKKDNISNKLVAPNFENWERVTNLSRKCTDKFHATLYKRLTPTRRCKGCQKSPQCKPTKSLSSSFKHKIERLKSKSPPVVNGGGGGGVQSDINGSTSAHDFTKIYALYFPQFHSDALNDRLWGKSFSDWDNLVASPTINSQGNAVIAPTELGMYDLRNFGPRRTQRAYAKYYGVDGFIYHHYWFYAPGMKATLGAPVEAMLVDGEPNISFAFHWANQNWTATWQGKGRQAGELLQEQFYPKARDTAIEEHYRYLKLFFQHKNYIKVNGVPLFLVFATYTPEVIPILNRLRDLAIMDGYPPPGLHIPQFRVNTEHPITDGRIPLKHRDTRTTLQGFESDFYYPSNHNFLGSRVPDFCLTGQVGPETRPVYLSTISTFDNTPRRNYFEASVWSRKWSRLGVARSFEKDLVEIMMYETCCQNPSARKRGGQFMVINAWNEWAEGMALEPSDVHGRTFLEAVKHAKTIVSSIDCSWDKYRLFAGFAH